MNWLLIINFPDDTTSNTSTVSIVVILVVLLYIIPTYTQEI